MHFFLNMNFESKNATLNRDWRRDLGMITPYFKGTGFREIIRKHS
jgi:hypothetical protein